MLFISDPMTEYVMWYGILWSITLIVHFLAQYFKYEKIVRANFPIAFIFLLLAKLIILTPSLDYVKELVLIGSGLFFVNLIIYKIACYYRYERLELINLPIAFAYLVIIKLITMYV